MPSLIPVTEQARFSIQGESLDLPNFPFRIGRESRNKNDVVSSAILERRLGKAPPNNDFYLLDDGRLLNISREHFLIEKDETGSFILRDRMSACGTIVVGKKGERRCHGTHCELSDGDTIVIGTQGSPYIFKFSAAKNAEPGLSWVVFDAMGVIYTSSDDVSDCLWPFVRRNNPGLDKKIFIDSYVRISLGRITCKEFWDRIGLGSAFPRIEREYLDTMLTLDSEFKQTAQRLQKRFKLGMLSNDVGDWSRYLRQKRFNIDFFNAAVISGDVFCRKPDIKIFEMFLEKSNARAADCVFIDDRKKNLEVAKSLGFKTIWFHRIEDSCLFAADKEISAFSQLEETVKSMS